jgi:hypothetical protein
VTTPPDLSPRTAFVLTDQEVAWRTDVVAELGADDDLAAAIGADSNVDVHTIAQLHTNGCPLHLAYEILR